MYPFKRGSTKGPLPKRMAHIARLLVQAPICAPFERESVGKPPASLEELPFLPFWNLPGLFSQLPIFTVTQEKLSSFPHVYIFGIPSFCYLSVF